MKYLSVCSGIEAATVAWHPLGWEPFAFAEIEKFPSAVLAHHYPHVPNLGDMTKHKDWPDAAIDVLVGGTPCQSFSVAGLRKGLADPRGNLALTYLAIADQYRPEWLVWENVPGVLSSEQGRDFGAFLGGLGELGYGFAYRVLDAQYVRVDGFPWAVPQRRRRVFVVGHLGDWRRAAAVLFERESLQGDSPPRRQAGQRASVAVAPCLRAGGNQTGGDRPYGTDVDTCDSLIAHALRADGFDASEDGTGRGTPLVPVAFAENSRAELRLCGGDGSVSSQLATGGGKPGQGQPCIAFSAKDHGGDAEVNLAPTLRAGGFTSSHANAGVMPAIAFDARQSDVIQYGEMTGPLDTDGHTMAVQAGWAVRRLTPRECERLQGFPGDYTLIPVRGKPAADGPRYKALGNSMAVNCMRWIGQRIAATSALSSEHAAPERGSK